MSDSTRAHWVIPVTGLTCASCVTRLEKALSKHPEVSQVNVNLALETLDIQLNDNNTAIHIPDWVAATGFGVETDHARFTLANITCASCVSRIEKTLLKLPGVSSATVNMATSQVDIRFTKGLTSPLEIKKRLADINYPVVSTAEHAEADSSKPSTLLRDALIGLTLSAPMLASMIASFINPMWMLPGWIQFILATPVQFYIGARFYTGAYRALKGGSANMDVLVALGTSTAYFYSLYLWLQTGTHHLYFEAAAVIISLVMLGKWLEERAKFIASNAIKQLMKLQPPTAMRWQGDKLEKVAVSDLSLDDELQIQPGDTIPADALILSGRSAIDEAMLTGESVPVEKSTNDMVMAGTRNTEGSLRVKVSQSPEHFRLRQIIEMVNQAQMQKPDIQRLVDRISAVFVPIVIAIALVTLALQLWLVDFTAAITAAVSVLVIACPCALGLATPTAIMASSGVGARLGILIRDMNQLQMLAKPAVYVFDKTGTLTLGEPTVESLHWLGEKPQQNLLARIKETQQNSQHPLANAIVNYLNDTTASSELINFKNHSGRGIEAAFNDGTLWLGNARLMADAGIPLPDSDLADPYSHVWIAWQGQLMGRFDLTDPVRQDAATTVAALKRGQNRVWMLSGDNNKVAEHTASLLGVENVMANLLPEHKAQAIEQLKKKSDQKVIMIGDGINDAPALASADASIAMGTGTDVAMDSSGITLMRSDLRLIVDAAALAEKTQSKIRQNLFWAFIYNCIGIPLAAFGLLTPIVAGAAMAFSSVSVVSSSILLLRWNPKPFKDEDIAVP